MKRLNEIIGLAQSSAGNPLDFVNRGLRLWNLPKLDSIENSTDRLFELLGPANLDAFHYMLKRWSADGKT